MASNAVFEFTDSNFQTEALESDIPVLVDFWAEWCQPCRMLGPTIDELAEDYKGRAKIGKLDVDSSRDVALKYNIQSIPAVFLIKNGEVVNRFVSINPKETYTKAIDELLANA
jgi:thioredoxin 1